MKKKEWSRILSEGDMDAWRKQKNLVKSTYYEGKTEQMHRELGRIESDRRIGYATGFAKIIRVGFQPQMLRSKDNQLLVQTERIIDRWRG